MKRPSREEYDRAVALAVTAIQASEARAPICFRKSPQAVLDEMRAKLARGEALTGADLEAMQAAMDEREDPPQRGRGRPKGTGNRAAKRAFTTAANAIEGTGLQTFRNSASKHCLTQCDALAEALRSAEITTFTTYSATERQMKSMRRGRRRLTSIVHGFGAKLRAAIREVGR